METYIQIEGLTKSFGDLILYDNVDFDIAEGQKLAIVAQNGKGKTTLLNIIAGREGVDAGRITYRRGLRIAYLEQSPQYDPDHTVWDAFMSVENELKALHKEWDYEVKAKQILSKLKIDDVGQKIGTLSGGQLKRVALANALVSEPDLLILDEPTNHLDLEMVEWLEDLLRRSRMTLLIVTHDRYFLDRVCSDILEIADKSFYRYKGNYSYYLEKRAERREQQEAEQRHAANLYRKELDWMRRQPQARGSKAKSRIDDFYVLEQKVKQKLSEEQVRLEVKSTYIGSKIFEAQYVSKSFGDKVILKDFYYNFARYEKLGVVGRNGTGKSTFIKLLLGLEKPDSGNFDIGETVRFGYYSQEGICQETGKKVIDVVRDIAEQIDLGGGRKLTAGQLLQHFMFSPARQYDYVEKLSGGERRRLYLCTVLMRNPNFLVLDEPTNDLDIVTLNILEDYLQNFKGCVLVVSHDRYFMDKIVDHLLVFKGGGQVQDFPGNYTDYRFWCEMRDKEQTAKAPAAAEGSPRVRKERARRLTYAEQKELAALEQEIEALEAEKKTIEEAFASGTLSGDDLMAKSARIAELIPLLDEKSTRWLELSEIGS
ncbi:MAG: ABC-F family ATP-binding cassette domain-containing protein [Paludibacteraceae bacterium]|nr:ABC-F family ATP-binding cassette domain-containing protein [Paludibacteraceae bacterium]